MNVAPSRTDDSRIDDLVQPFHIEHADVSGRLVRLGPSIDRILGEHGYPGPVAGLLGELVVVAAATAGAYKFQGTLSLQTSSDGPVPLMIAEYRAPDGEDRHTVPARLRAYARYDADAVTEAAARPGSVARRLLGAGLLAFTVEASPGAERHQSIIALDGATLAESMHAYFRQSDQFDAALRVDVGHGDAGWRAVGVMLQRIPPPGRALGARGDDEWRHALARVGSADRSDLLDPAIAPTSMLRRLFPEDDVRAYRPVPVEARCRCSRGRVEDVLRSFPAAEIAAMAVDGTITVTCEFCNRTYAFAPTKLGAGSQTNIPS